MKNTLKILICQICLFVFLVLYMFPASLWGCACIPNCTSCKTCQSGVCVSKCSSSLCQTCVNGICQSSCNSNLCQTCVNGVCQSSCDSNSRCINGECIQTGIHYTYNSVGNRISMIDPAGTTSYTYDYLGRLTSVTNPDNKTISYQYDAGGNRTQLTDPNGNITTYTYDDNNRLTEVNAPAGLTVYQYDSLGRQIRVDYPNGTYTEYNYNSQRNWLVSLVNKEPNDAVMSSYSYTYDNAGNRLSVTENGGSVVSYSYDDIYQLTSETRTGSNAYTITYQYDDVGNRTQMVNNAVATNYTYNTNNQLLTETTNGATITYAYDLNGNLITKTTDANTTTAYAWDWNDRLLSVTEADGVTVYEYDGLGNRVGKTESGVKTKYINDVGRGLVNVLMETTDTNIVEAVYTYGNDLITADFTDFRGYYHYDGLGSVKQMTNDSGTIVANYVYDSFGNSVASASSVANSYGFTGEQQFEEADNMVFLRHRYYSPAMGRFISKDKIGYKGGINLYVYCKNRPIVLIDPAGLSPWYGGYCGPGSSGGTPIDDLDSACKDHDDCYGESGMGGVGGVVCPSKDRRKCDANLCVNAAASRCTTRKCEAARAIIMAIFCSRAIAPL